MATYPTMENDTLVALAKAAGVGGLALGVLALLMRQFLALPVFSQMSSPATFKILRLFLYLICLVVVTALSLWTYATTRIKHDPDPNALREFSFHYKFGPDPGRRLWTQQNSTTYIEQDEHGRMNEFEVVDKTYIDDCHGTRVRKNTEHEFEVFIPDRTCSRRWLMYRWNNRPWDWLAEIQIHQ